MEKDKPLPQIITVKSSAGAGKTYKLAQHYIALLLIDVLSGKTSKNHIANLVAITFTNKAAQEMRGRIIDWMKRIILDIPFEQASQTSLDDILEHEQLQPGNAASSGTEQNIAGPFREKVRQTIERDFYDLLNNYYSFNVSTIDSFVNLILKASAFKLNLPPDFDISLDSSLMIDLVLKECLQKISEDDLVRMKFDRFIDNYIETEGDSVSWLPKELLKNIISGFWNEELKENKDFCVDSHSRARVADLREEIEIKAQKLKEALAANLDILPQSNFLKALNTCIDIQGNVPGRSIYFQKTTLGECLIKKSCPADSAHESLWQDLQNLRGPFVEAVSQSKFTSYIEIYDLFKEILKTEITYRKRLVLIEQLNRLLQDIIHKTDFVPEIYYALSERYTHFLIDEFQDTNHLQWKNIEILTEEAIARGGTLFLVGDKKQAIYRWRGGKSELVDEVARRYHAYRVDEQILDTNYRSAGQIVLFNNEVFSTDNLAVMITTILSNHPTESKKKVLNAYRGSEQQPLENKKEIGYVCIEKVTAIEEGDIREAFTKNERNEIVMEKFRKLISEIRQRKVFQDKDIAVLVRTKEEAKLVVGTLLEMGINVESELTVNVKNNHLVGEFFSFLKFINSPDDDLAFTSFISGIIFQQKTGVSHKEIIEWITEKRTEDNRDHLYISFRADYQFLWKAHFEDFFKRSGYLPLYEFVVLFFKRWSLFINFPDEIPYFLHICELIKNREDSQANNLSAFLQSLETIGSNPFATAPESEKTFLLKTSEAANAIKVLTVHKAKGLEFPVVILPFMKLTSFSASEGRDKTKYYISENNRLKLLYIKKDFREISQKLDAICREKEIEYLLDELNNTYVAFTRAGKELYAFLTDAKGYKKNYLIDYLFNLDSLKNAVKGDTITMGWQYELPPDSSLGKGPEETSDATDPFLYDNLGEDIRWLERISTKFAVAGNISRQQLHAKKKGDVIHYILSLIPFVAGNTDNLITQSIRTGIARFHFSPYGEEIGEIVKRFFGNDRFMVFFTLHDCDIIFTEKEIIDKKGNTFKIDRMIVRNEAVDIVDFKSGETRTNEHREQISHYAGLIKEIYPGKPVRSHLLYIEEQKVISL